MVEARGATPQEWGHLDMMLGLGSNLLPCVPASPDVTLLEGSALKGKLGKIPSMFYGDKAGGIKGWQKKVITGEELHGWRNDPRLNACVRTGPISGVYAIDVDVEEEARVRAISQLLYDAFASAEHPLYYRTRPNSEKLLVPFKLSDGSCKKRIIETAQKQRIELLGEGQQFVACGTHSSGVRYAWSPLGLPSQIPSLTLRQLDALWQQLQAQFGTTPQAPATPDTTATPDSGEGTRTALTDGEWNDLISALRALLEHAGDNDEWSEIGYALLSIRHTRPARQLWCDFSRKAPGYEEGAPERWWEQHETQTPRSDYRHIFSLARAKGWGRASDPAAFPPLVGEEAKLGDHPPPARPLCRVIGGNLPHLANQATELLKPELYTNAQQLVKIGQPYLQEKGVRRDLFQPIMLRTVNAPWLGLRLTELARWQKFDGRKNDWVDIDCPDSFADKFARFPEWPGIRPLDGILTAPFIRADGSVCDTPGYDARSRTLYQPSAKFPPIAQAPTQKDAVEALARVMVPFNEFPFKDPLHASAFVAHLLTECSRMSMDTAPVFFYTAAEPGSGKTLLSEMPCLIAHGYAPPARPWARTEEEMRKAIFAAMLDGDRSITFDNAPSGTRIPSPALCGVVTSPIWKDRVLGVSHSSGVVNHTTIAVTGNNIVPVQDMARRSLVIRLESDPSTMRARRFKIQNLRAYVVQHRVELLVDVLTILRAHRLSKDRSGLPLLPSFEEWSEQVRDCVLWLGLRDPVETQIEETDDETSSLASVFTALGATFNGAPFLSADVATLVAANDQLNAALLEAGCTEPFKSQKVGDWLRTHRGRRGGGWRLEKSTKLLHGSHRWYLKRHQPNNGDLV